MFCVSHWFLIYQFYHWKNEDRVIFNEQRYRFIWFFHGVCYVLLSVALAVPLYVENTRIFYTDLFWSMFATFLYSMWLWIGARVFTTGMERSLASEATYSTPTPIK